MQDINISEREGEISNRKHGRFVLIFEPLALRPRLHHYEGIHYNDPITSLGATTPTTSSLKNSWTCMFLTCSRKNNIREPQARGGRNLYNSLIEGVEHL